MWQSVQLYLVKHSRKITVGLIAALVVATPYAVVLVAQHYKHTNLHAAANCTPDSNLVNPCRPWLGAWSVHYPQAPNGVKNQIFYHESRIGRQVDLVKDYASPGNSLNSDDKYFIGRPDTYLLLTWKPAGNFGSGASSSAYSSIDAMANSIKTVAPHKIFLSVWHEPENDVTPGTTSCSNAKGGAGSPAEYRAMWANVRNRFNALGVNNVVWTFIPMGYSGWNCMEKDMWPGNSLVDWVMWDPYGAGDSDSWNKTMSPFYNWMSANNDATHAYLSKAWGIAETSIHWYSNQASGVSYWQGAKAALDANTFPRIKAYVVFDSDNGKPDNRIGYWCKAWTNETCNAGQTVADPGKQAVYKAFANDPAFSNPISCSGSCGGPDITPPAVSVTGPVNGATISGSVTLTATASDNIGVSRVVFSVDGAEVATDTSSPYAAVMDTTKNTNANHTIQATAYDAAGNTKAHQITVTVKNAPNPPPPTNDTTPPVATITSPTANAKVGGTVNFSVDAQDNVGIVKVVFTVDGNVAATDMAPPYTMALNTTLYSNANHVIRAKAYDAAGNTKTPQETITVSNASEPPPPTILSLTASPGSLTVGEKSTLSWTSVNAIDCSVTPDGPQKTTLTAWTTVAYTSTGVKTYTLTCYNSAGKTVTSSVKVTVNPAPEPPAKPSLSADTTTVAPGGSVLLGWASAGATSCVLNPGNVTASGGIGSSLMTNLQQTTSYTVACKNNDGTVTSSITIAVSKVAVVTHPVISKFAAVPSDLGTGGVATLSWSTTDVVTNGCALQPGPLTTAASSGQWQTPVLTTSTSFTLTCKDGRGELVSRSLGVTVNGRPAPAPPAQVPPLSSEADTPTVKAIGGQTIVNGQKKSTVKRGELLTLDPSNIQDEKKIASILRVEYYNAEKLIQIVETPPYALDTATLPGGRYTLTERTYFVDGSVSERTQVITISASPVATKKSKNPSVTILLWSGVIIVIISAAILIRRKMSNQAPSYDYDQYATLMPPAGTTVAPQRPPEKNDTPPSDRVL